MVCVVNSCHALTNKIFCVVCRFASFVEKFIITKGGMKKAIFTFQIFGDYCKLMLAIDIL